MNTEQQIIHNVIEPIEDSTLIVVLSEKYDYLGVYSLN